MICTRCKSEESEFSWIHETVTNKIVIVLCDTCWRTFALHLISWNIANVQNFDFIQHMRDFVKHKKTNEYTRPETK